MNGKKKKKSGSGNPMKDLVAMGKLAVSLHVHPQLPFVSDKDLNGEHYSGPHLQIFMH